MIEPERRTDAEPPSVEYFTSLFYWTLEAIEWNQRNGQISRKFGLRRLHGIWLDRDCVEMYREMKMDHWQISISPNDMGNRKRGAAELKR